MEFNEWKSHKPRRNPQLGLALAAALAAASPTKATGQESGGSFDAKNKIKAGEIVHEKATTIPAIKYQQNNTPKHKHVPQGAELVQAGKKITKQPTLEHRKKDLRIPRAEDGELISKYLNFSANLHGAYIQQNEDLVPQTAFEEFCKELSIFCEEFAERF